MLMKCIDGVQRNLGKVTRILNQMDWVRAWIKFKGDTMVKTFTQCPACFSRAIFHGYEGKHIAQMCR